MPCHCGETILLASGHCSTPGCPNKQPAQEQALKRKARSPLRKTSAKKRKELKETKAIREVGPGEQCELCLSTEAVSTHEVPAGSHRHRAVYDRRCQIRVCEDCHRQIQGLQYELQIILKVEAMIAGVNESLGRVAVSTESIKEML